VDVCSLRQYGDRPEGASWSFHESGFWSAEPHACLSSFLRYDEARTYAERYVIVEKENIRCFNIWNRWFTTDELLADLQNAGFKGADFFDTVAGDPLTEGSETICAVACT
jgi:antirestriction protein ArdC